jgi:polysaccharide biosynthesis transport protein
LELAAYRQLLRRWWLPLLAAAWVAGMLGFILGSQIPPTYESRARLLVGPVNTDVDTLRAAEALAQTFAELATTEPQLRAVIERLGLDMEPIDLAQAAVVRADGTTRIISIVISDSDAARGAAVANGLGEELIELASAPGGRPEGELFLIDPAVPGVASVGPSPTLIALLAGAAGLLIAGLFAAIVEYLSHTVKDRHDLGAITQAPVLGEIRFGKGYMGTPMQPLVVEAQPESRTALGYRLLVSRMPMLVRGRRVHSILVVGAQVGDGRGEFAANLAAVMVRTGRSVTLVDADDLEGQVTRMFALNDRMGLGELVKVPGDTGPDADTLSSVRQPRPPGLDIIPVGDRESPLMVEQGARRLLESMRGHSDLVILSGAPIHRSASSLVWARVVDAVVLVAREEATQIENLRYAVESLRLVDANLAGTVLLERRRGTSRRAPRQPAQPATGAQARPAAEAAPPPAPRAPRRRAPRTARKSAESTASTKRAG